MTAFPDAEMLVADMLEPVGNVVMFLPENAKKRIDLGQLFVLVQRIGGSDDGVTDRAEVMVTCWANTRPKAWEASRRVKGIVDQFSTGGRVGDTWVDATWCIQSGVQLSSDDPEERYVSQQFRVDTRRQ